MGSKYALKWKSLRGRCDHCRTSERERKRPNGTAKIANKKYMEMRKIATRWHVSVLYPIHKKRYTMVCHNYTGIFFLNISYKILSNIILNRTNTYKICL